MIERILAQRYASALYEAARAQTLEVKIHEQTVTLLSLIRSNPDLALFLKHPRLKENMQQEIVKTLFKKNFDHLFIQFLNLMIQKKRLAIIEPVCEAFENIYFQKNNIMKAKITSAVMLSESQLKKLTQKLENKFQKKIIPEMSVDSKLLGGFKINIKETIMDYSLSGQLDEFYRRIIHAH